MRLSFVYPEALWLLVLLPALWILALNVPRRMGRTRFVGSLLLRSALILALVLSLAGTQLVQPVDNQTTVFLIDSSDSVSASLRGRAEIFVEQALANMRTGDQAAVVVFGGNALVERSPSEEQGLGRISSVPLASRTDIQEAIQLGLALLPADSQKRLVLLSDGGENSGRAVEAAQLAEARGIPIEIVSLAAPSDGGEALVAELSAPSVVRDGQELELVAVVESTQAQPARLRFFADEQLIAEQDVQLQVGQNRFALRVPASGQGFARYSAQIEPQSDARAQNNEAAALVRVQGPPRVLLVEGEAGEAANLQAALAAAQVSAEITSPQSMPVDLAGLSAFDAVVLMNVPARELPVRAMEALPRYVRELGKGLIMLGGDQSFGVGGYGRTPLEEALPVYMDVRNREERPNIALVFVIDKSGSMDACHCAGPNRQSNQIQQGGVPKVDIAKEAVIEASALLGPQDSLGVVAFDESADWALPVTQGPSNALVEQSVSTILPDGNTNVRAGLNAAFDQLQQVDARIKHAVLLTDGWSTGGDNLDLVAQMREAGITLSVVAAGSGSAEYLEQLAAEGGGRFYPAEDMADVPQIFVNETITAVGNYIVERPFVPGLVSSSPVLAGIDSVPTLYGYNGSTIKDSAQLVLVTDDGSPLLAQWQYGLGRSIAFTSDASGRWARDWLAWERFPQFAAQLTGWVLPTRSNQQIETDLHVEGNQASIQVSVRGDDGQPREDLSLEATLVGVDGSSQVVRLQQVAPGEYRAALASPQPGSYLVQIAGEQDEQLVLQETAGLVVPYSPEYRTGQSNQALLDELARLTNGRALLDPAQAFERNLSSVWQAREIGLPLLWLALLLLPLDIAVRRLLLRRSDLSAFIPARRLAPAGPASPPDPRLNRLSQAKARTRNQPAVPGAEANPPRAEPAPAQRPQTPELPPAPPERSAPAQEADALARLREAKERARRRARGEE